MYVDNNLVLATADDVSFGSITDIGGGSYLYVSDTIDLGNSGSRGLPFDSAMLRISSSSEFSAVGTCLVTIRLVSGSDPTLFADLALGTFTPHFQSESSSLAWGQDIVVINTPIPASPNGYQRYLGVTAVFNGGGLDAGRISIMVLKDTYENRPLVDALPS